MRWIPCRGWLVITPSEIDDQFGSLFLPKSAVERAAGWICDVVLDGGPPLPVEDEEPDMLPILAPGSWILSPPRRFIECDEEGLLVMPRSSAWAILE